MKPTTSYSERMNTRSLNLLILMAITIAMTMRSEFIARHIDFGNGLHTHLHTHAGDADPHVHAHHHGDLDGNDEDSEDHHSELDHQQDVEKIRWNLSRRVEINISTIFSSPTYVATFVAIVSTNESEPVQQAKPPPRAFAHTQYLNSIKTVILRL